MVESRHNPENTDRHRPGKKVKYLKMKVIENLRSETINAEIEAGVDQGTHVTTDDCSSYKKITPAVVQYLHLRTRDKKYRKRGDKKAGRGHSPNRTDIGQRPKVVDRKERLGDLEIDLIIGKDHKGAFLTINDRSRECSKWPMLRATVPRDVEMTKELLEDRVPFIRTITSDNGKEFANQDRK